MGGVSPGRFICRELAGRKRCKTALAASLSDTEQPQAEVESLLGSVSPSHFCFVQAAGWKLSTSALPGGGHSAGHRESRPFAQAMNTTIGNVQLGPGCRRGSAGAQHPSPSTNRASTASSSQASRSASVGADTSRQEWELAPQRLAPQVNCGVP